MVKKAIIEILLVEGADEKPSEDLEKEILEEISTYPARIPWMREVTRVKVEKV